jgi:alkaline phosphatase D
MRENVLRAGIAAGVAAILGVAAGEASASPVGDKVYIQSGDIASDSAVIWARCNQETLARMIVRLTPQGGSEMLLEGPIVAADTDWTGSLMVDGLTPNTRYSYEVQCFEYPTPEYPDVQSSPVGTFRTAAAADRSRDVSFVWYADIAGQGWGRNPDLTVTTVQGDTLVGGFPIFEVMRRLKPQFAVNSGDAIYADNAVPPSVAIPAEVGGGTWINSPAKDFIAVSLDQFRANWLYNLGDQKMRQFLRQTPVYSQWDDHEVTNNWYPGEILTTAPYNGLPADFLALAGRQSMYDYNPIVSPTIYRKFNRGANMDLFILDERSFRGPNPEMYDPNGIEMLGREQFQWLKTELKNSKATWKVIASDDPLSIVTGGDTDRDAWSQGADAVLGREVQLARLLKFIKDEGIKNVVVITADVHFAAAIAYDPARATFTDFNPFWEFVIGPSHAGAFGPAGNLPLDASFGPTYAFRRDPGTEGFATVNLPPPNLQSFGWMEIAKSGQLTARIYDITGAVIYEKILTPQ